MGWKRPAPKPGWITARFISKCSRCGRRIVKGERIFYYPADKTALCSDDGCGQQAQRDIAADDFDQAQYDSQY